MSLPAADILVLPNLSQTLSDWVQDNDARAQAESDRIERANRLPIGEEEAGTRVELARYLIEEALAKCERLGVTCKWKTGGRAGVVLIKPGRILYHHSDKH